MIETLFKRYTMLLSEVEEPGVNSPLQKSASLFSIIIPAVVILLMFIFVVFIVRQYRILSKMRTRAEENFMHMEVYMKNRHQMIPKFVMFLKKSSNVNFTMLDAVINARNIACQTKSRDQKVLAEADLQRKLNILYDTIRNSSTIEKDEEFDDYLAQMRTVESQVARTRIAYNDAVGEYNSVMGKFWSKFIISMFGFELEEEFKIEETTLPSEYHL